MRPKKGTFYKHFKGDVYQVLGYATCTETMKEKILYKSFKDGVVWSRDLQEFTDIHPEQNVERFRLMQ